MTSIPERIEAEEARRYQEGFWVPACGRTEEPFTINGRRLLYVWHTAAHIHAYLDLGTDMILSDEELKALHLT